MKVINNVVLSLLIMVGVANAGPVDDIIQLCQSGMAEDIVIAAAKKQLVGDMTTAQILAVKSACKSDNIVRALMGQPGPVTAVVPISAGNVSKSGFYLVSNGQMNEISPVSLRRTGFKKGLKGLGSLMKMSPKMTAELSGSRATVRTGRQPEFVISGIDKNFLLVRLEQKDGKRVVIVGSGGLMGVQGGFEEKSLTAFNLDRSVGRITFGHPLERGEYIFYPVDAFRASGEANLELTGQGYDFGVD